MKSLQEYINIYRGIGRRMNLQGDSVELLAQMLANATYISEVEHLSYTQEASIERASHMNSKIQHCMNEMYSVFRGECPRVIINFTSSTYFDLNLYDELASFNNFNLYYIGYYNPSSEENINSKDPHFTYGPTVIPPNQDATIIALLSPKCLLGNWTISSNNQYYVDFLEPNLSNDIQVKVNDEVFPITRLFSDHVKNGSIFDLTLPDFSLRLYAPDIFRENNRDLENISVVPTGTKISLKAFRFSELSSYNNSELKSIKVKGTKLIPFDENLNWNGLGLEIAPGLIVINEVPRDTLGTIHYKANRDKYVGSILRSNSDIGYLLEEMYPEKIYESGTSYKFEEGKKISRKITNFGFEPDNIENTEDKNYLRLTSNTGSDQDLLSIETRLKDKNNSGGLLTVYSAKDYPVAVYFNNNPEVDFKSEKYPQMSFFGSKLTLETPGKFQNNKPYGGIIQIPISGSGVLRLFHKAALDIASHTIYQILPEMDIITEKDESFKLIISGVKKNSDGFTQVIPQNKFNINNFIFTCELISNDETVIGEQIDPVEDGTIYISSEITNNKSLKGVKVNLYFKNSEGEPDTDNLLAQEVIPMVRSYSETSTEKPINDLVLNLNTDLISIESDQSGNILTNFPITVYSTTYYQGLTLKEGVRYSVEKNTGIECEIDTDGVLTITSIDNTSISGESSIFIRASHLGMTITTELKLRTSLNENAYKSRVINISSDLTGNENSVLARYNSGLAESISEFNYKNVENISSLYLWLSGIGGVDIYSIEWISDEIIEKTETSLYPKLSVYYIPKTPSSTLSASEINNYIESRKSYFVTQEISVLRGTQINALVTMDIILFRNVSIDSEVKSILNKYSNSFNLDLESKVNEIKSSLGKISNIRSLEDLRIIYTTELGDEISVDGDYKNLDFNYTYFTIEYRINSTISNN